MGNTESDIYKKEIKRLNDIIEKQHNFFSERLKYFNEQEKQMKQIKQNESSQLRLFISNLDKEHKEHKAHEEHEKHKEHIRKCVDYNDLIEYVKDSNNKINELTQSERNDISLLKLKELVTSVLYTINSYFPQIPFDYSEIDLKTYININDMKDELINDEEILNSAYTDIILGYYNPYMYNFKIYMLTGEIDINNSNKVYLKMNLSPLDDIDSIMHDYKTMKNHILCEYNDST